ncbi:MAG: acyltransferase, partial [Pseudomonadota bacterium]
MLSKFFSLPSARVLPVAQAGYRPEIDGLRAIAVLMVILFHSGLDAASGGFTGVDVFFVISGYLIARIILTELDEGRFSFLRFYERRVRR